MQPLQKFPYLDSLRFLAALLVFLAHFGEFTRYYQVASPVGAGIWTLQFGSIGVTSFFVLSGFLITWLLLNEKATTGKIKLKNFYVRRILRIWPLYFLITALAFLIVNNVAFFQIPGYDADYRPHLVPILIFFLILLPQVPYLIYPAVPYANILWSIGVEELFYFFWPFAIRKRRMVLTCVLIILIWLCAKALVLILRKFNVIPQSTAAVFIEFIERNRFYCFAFGGLAAYCYKYYQSKCVHLLNKLWIQIPAIFLFLATLLSFIRLKYFYLVQQECISVCVSVMIIGCVSQNALYGFFNSSVLRYLGKISYGIYCYHLFAIVAVYKIWGKGKVDWGEFALMFFLSMSITIVLASASYYFIERRFLKLKKNFY